MIEYRGVPEQTLIHPVDRDTVLVDQWWVSRPTRNGSMILFRKSGRYFWPWIVGGLDVPLRDMLPDGFCIVRLPLAYVKYSHWDDGQVSFDIGQFPDAVPVELELK